MSSIFHLSEDDVQIVYPEDMARSTATQANSFHGSDVYEISETNSIHGSDVYELSEANSFHGSDVLGFDDSLPSFSGSGSEVLAFQGSRPTSLVEHWLNDSDFTSYPNVYSLEDEHPADEITIGGSSSSQN